MATQQQRCLFSWILPLALLYGSASVRAGDDFATIDLFSFEEAVLPSGVHADHAAIEIVSSEGVTSGKQALKVTLPPDLASAGVRFVPTKPWDCETLGRFRFTFDVTNVKEGSVHLHCEVASGKGRVTKRSVAIPKGGPHTFYFELEGDGIGTDRGLRDDPPSLEGCGTKMLIDGLKQDIDYSQVKRISLFVTDASEEGQLVFDNLRFAENPPIIDGYLEGLTDEFGQNAKVEFEGKVESEKQLQELARAELAELAKLGPMSDRSKFSGWKSGPRLNGTGYFRTEKVGDRWALVDPEGYLYFATGIDNLRMANTATFTGVDFTDPAARYRDPNDVTPEDSQGVIPSTAEVRKSRVITSPLRHKMFNWLPGYDHPLAKHYGYRRSAHLGPVEHGEIFSFYQANLERRYGEATAEQTLAKWREVTTDRMLSWGFTSLGNWTDAAFYQDDRIPYFANGWIIGDFKTLSHGYWGAMPDPFDPEFARRALVTTETIAAEVQGNPWCVGVFIDNEKSWGNSASNKSRYGIAIDALSRDAKDSPTKAVYVETLQKKYGEIGKLNAAWGTDVASWEAFAAGFPKAQSYTDPEQLADLSTLAEIYTDKYFKVVHDALEKVMPNHLYLGARLTPWGLTPETWRAASRYCDVMSYNFYREALGTRNWEFLEELDMPSIIGEFHMGATDRGAYHPGIIHAADQEDRGRMFKAYMESVIDNPYFVGAHWFQYIDSPITGRDHDGENYNVGFVTITDVPYKPIVESAKSLNASLYERRFGKSTR